MNHKELWENVLVDIELLVSRANFKTWFRDTQVARVEDGIVYVHVPTELAREWLSQKFHREILKALRSFIPDIRAAEYIVKRDTKPRESAGEESPRITLNAELPLKDYYINKNDNLNPRYTFETFVVGPFNELAYAAAQAVVGNPGITYNPLFIYGETGRGKTHLIQAVGNQLKKQHPDKKIYYVTSEKFTVDYVTAIQNARANQFKEKYRQYDVLIMDDIQFFSKKEQTQEELFHLFNVLYDNNKQIVFSSDKHVNYIPNLEERLKSRFSAGMIVDVPAPDRESRSAIIKAKALQNKFVIDDDIVLFLAETIEGNIRDLEGVLNAIICQSHLKGRVLSLSEVKHLIKDSIKPRRSVSVKDVIKHVSNFYNIDEMNIYEKTRRKEIVKPRQIIMYLLREDFNVSYPSIGAKLGGRDHTTVIHSCEKVKHDLKGDASLAQELNQIRATL